MESGRGALIGVLYTFIFKYLFIFGWAWSLLLPEGFLLLQ